MTDTSTAFVQKVVDQLRLNVCPENMGCSQTHKFGCICADTDVAADMIASLAAERDTLQWKLDLMLLDDLGRRIAILEQKAGMAKDT